MILALVILFMLTTKLHSFAVFASKGPGRKLSTSIKMSSTFPKRLPVVKDMKSEAQRLEENQRVSRCIQFLDSSPEPFHVVHTVIQKLSLAGFTRLDEGDLWNVDDKIKRGGKYYFTRNGSSIVAFTVGMNFVAGKSGFKVIGAHTDSPNLKLKPRTKKTANGLVQLGVESYGGGLWHTWFDRDLSIAGRVIMRTSVNGVPSYKHHLIKIDRPVLRIPNLCIHLNTPKEREAFAVNKEDHLAPILCDFVEKTMSKKDGKDADPVEEADQWGSEQTPELLSLLSEELKCQLEDIVDFELSLYDTQGAAVSGYREEFLCSSRIDNLASCFVALEALVAHSSTDLDVDEDISVVAFFDHEEVGSDSNSGAGSTIMRDAVVRLVTIISI
jgi:aspartyl aminopeptidase